MESTIPVLAEELYHFMKAIKTAESYLQKIAGARLAVFAAGHTVPIELPDEFNWAVVEFLSECEAERR